VKRLTLILLGGLLASGCATIRSVKTFKDPLSGEEHFQLATAYEARGEMAGAEREYRAVTRRDKKNLAAHIGLGNAAFAQGRHKEAELAFLRALRLSKKNAAASNNLAMLYASQGRKLKKAENLASHAAKDARFRPYALDTLATVYLQQGRKDDARAAVAEARSLAPANDPNFLPGLEKTAQSIGE